MKRALALALLLLTGTAAAQPPSDVPPGHPPIDEPGDGPGPMGPQPDEVSPSAELPAGSIAVIIVDAANQRMAGAPIELDVMRNTVAQGESHNTERATTDARGEARFDGLRTGNAMSYQVRTRRGDAVLVSDRFVLKEKNGVEVLLHAYDPVSSLERVSFAVEAYVLLDIKQDTIRVNHLLHTYNLGQTAYVPHGLTMQLPEGARAFNLEQGPDEVTMTEHDGVVQINGTFPPGQAELTYAYTLPLDDGPNLRLRLPLPPRVLGMQVSASAGPGMDMEIAGFPKAELGRRRDGVRVLQAAKQLDTAQNPQVFFADTRPVQLDLTLHGLPSRGIGPGIAVLLALLAVVVGMLYRWTAKSAAQSDDLARELGEARDALLDELVVLERAHKSGEVGPKSYERLRAALLDALARIVARLERAPAGKARS